MFPRLGVRVAPSTVIKLLFLLPTVAFPGLPCLNMPASSRKLVIRSFLGVLVHTRSRSLVRMVVTWGEGERGWAPLFILAALTRL